MEKETSHMAYFAASLLDPGSRRLKPLLLHEGCRSALRTSLSQRYCLYSEWASVIGLRSAKEHTVYATPLCKSNGLPYTLSTGHYSKLQRHAWAVGMWQSRLRTRMSKKNLNGLTERNSTSSVVCNNNLLLKCGPGCGVQNVGPWVPAGMAKGALAPPGNVVKCFVH